MQSNCVALGPLTGTLVGAVAREFTHNDKLASSDRGLRLDSHGGIGSLVAARAE